MTSEAIKIFTGAGLTGGSNGATTVPFLMGVSFRETATGVQT